MSVPPSVEAREKTGERTPQIPFFPHYVLHDVMWWYVALAVLAALALFLPWERGIKADAFAPVCPTPCAQSQDAGTDASRPYC